MSDDFDGVCQKCGEDMKIIDKVKSPTYDFLTATYWMCPNRHVHVDMNMDVNNEEEEKQAMRIIKEMVNAKVKQ